MVAVARARRAAPVGAQRRVVEQRLEQRRVRRGRGPRARGARGSRRARRGRGRRPAGTRPGRRASARSIARSSTCSSSRKRSTRPAHAHEVAAVEAAGRAGRRRGTRGRAARRCDRAARARGTACRCGRSAGPCACTRRRPRARRRRAAVARGRRSATAATADHGARAGRVARAVTVTPMQPLRWERRPDGLRAPALVCAFKGWNDAGESATSALTFLGAPLDGDALRDDRPRGVRRLPGHAADACASSRAARARSRGPRSRSTRRASRARRATSSCLPAPSRRSAGARSASTVIDLAEALGVPARRHARRAAGRRPALAPRLDHRPGVRRALVERLGLHRRTTRGRRDRRRPARRLRRRRACHGLAVGGGPALRRGRAEPEGRARARCASSRRSSA